MGLNLAAIRTDYARSGLDERDLAPSPLRQLERWLEEAVAAGQPEPNAMTLATVDDNGELSARVVLLKGIDSGLVFFTNYDSDKARALAACPRASSCFFWVVLERQVRVRGDVARISRRESEAYFRTRPRQTQLGAWASAQSRLLASREELAERLADVERRFPGEVPCPPHWGGFRITPRDVEFWQGRPNRLHDRLRYVRSADGSWRIERLSP